MTGWYSKDDEGTTHYDGWDRGELRELIWPKDNNYEMNRFGVDVRFLRLFGTSAGVFLSRLVYWDEKGEDPAGWTHKTKEQARVEFDLDSIYAVDEARHRLEVAGVLEEEKRARRRRDGSVWSSSETIHYRPKLAALAALLEDFKADPEGTAERLNQRFKRAKVTRSNARGSRARIHMNVASKQARVAQLSVRRTRARTREGNALESGKVTCSYAVATTSATSGGTTGSSSDSPYAESETPSNQERKKFRFTLSPIQTIGLNRLLFPDEATEEPNNVSVLTARHLADEAVTAREIAEAARELMPEGTSLPLEGVTQTVEFFLEGERTRREKEEVA